MKLRTTIALLFLFPVFASAQIDTVGQYVMGAAGGHGDDGTYAMSFTIGEPIIATIGANATFLTQGFHQDNLIVSTLDELIPLDLNISAYPNPAGSFINLDSDGLEGIQISLRDLRGREMIHMESHESVTRIDLDRIPNATYLLFVLDEDGGFLKSFKVQKIQ